jgi:hypothetical protein
MDHREEEDTRVFYIAEPARDRPEHPRSEVVDGQSSVGSVYQAAGEEHVPSEDVPQAQPDGEEAVSAIAVDADGEDAGKTDGSRADEDGEYNAVDDVDELNRVIEELCTSKAEEFALLGYEGITGKDIWEYLSEQYEKTGYPRLHRLINDILSLRVTKFMNWLTLHAYKGSKFHE